MRLRLIINKEVVVVNISKMGGGFKGYLYEEYPAVRREVPPPSLHHEISVSRDPVKDESSSFHQFKPTPSKSVGTTTYLPVWWNTNKSWIWAGELGKFLSEAGGV